MQTYVFQIWLLSSLLLRCGAQYPPPSSNYTTVRSPANGNVTISFRQPPVGTCTTVFLSQKQYTGYVTLPPFTLAPIQQNYTTNTFFWFVEARSNSSTAPLTVYINGGPGSSSMVGLFQETGPCEVVEIANGQLGTQARDWGWDRVSNMLYIDQPNQVGFSYDKPTNGTLDILGNNVIIPPEPLPSGDSLFTLLNGTFSSGNQSQTANTTAIAAHAIWHILQAFLSSFPQYNPGTMPNSTQPGVVGVNLFAESYGGKYGPIFAQRWEEQNRARSNGSVPRQGTVDVKLASLGLIQGCVDDLVQGRYYPMFSNNNTYGVQALSLVDQQTAANSFLRTGGCQQQIQKCRDAGTAHDPTSEGDVPAVSDVCAQAQQTCNDEVIGPYQSSGRDVYDITQKTPTSFPPSFHQEYLNSALVQGAVGAPVNYTETSPAVFSAFLATGDAERGATIPALASLLAQGVRVALIYGDRDYACNWLGGEAVSFAVAAQSSALSPFYGAGYADIVTNSSYVGGAVRQYGNLSFSRVYDSGHLVPAYQPETAFTIFTRVVLGTEISTGEPVDLAKYVSSGPANSTYQNVVPPQQDAVCWPRDADRTCSSDQQDAIKKGDGVLINGAWYEDPSKWRGPSPEASTEAGVPGSVPSAMTATAPVSGVMATGVPPTPTRPTESMPTGYYIATATPSTRSVACGGWQGASVMMSQAIAVAALLVVSAGTFFGW